MMVEAPPVEEFTVALEARPDGGYAALLRDGTTVTFTPPFSVVVALPDAETAARFERWNALPPSKPYRSRRTMLAKRREAELQVRAYPEISCAELARIVGVSPSTIRRWAIVRVPR